MENGSAGWQEPEWSSGDSHYSRDSKLLAKRSKVTGNSLRHAFKEIIWPRRKLIALGLLLILLNRISGLVLPASTKYLIDDVLGQSQFDLLYWLLGLLVVAVIVQAATAYLLTLLLSVEAQHLIAQLRAQVQRHVLTLPVRFFDSIKTGELVERIMNDVEGVRNLVGTGLVQLVGGTVTAIVAFTFLARIDFVMTLLVLVPLGLFGCVSTRAFQTLRPAFRERGELRAEVTGRLTEALGGIRVIKGFHAIEKEGEIFEAGVLRIFQNVKRTLTTSSTVTSLGTFFVGTAGVLIMGYGGRQILQGSLTLGDLFSFTLFMGFLIAPILQMANIGTQMTEAFAGLDRTAELLSWPSEDDDPRRTRTMPSVDGHLVFEDVGFAYDEDKPVLRGINFEAEPGTVIALVGSSGSGKSTLAGLAATFLTPDSGRVLMDGVEPGHRKAVELPITARPGIAGRLPLRRHDPREPSLRTARRHGGGSCRTRPSRPTSRSSPIVSRMAWTRLSVSVGSSCQEASASGSPSPGRCCPIHGCCCSTRQPPASTRRARR